MNRIKEIRKAAGLTQEALAEKVSDLKPGTTKNTIWRLENEDINLTHEWMTILAQVLRCTPADLIANVVMAEVTADIEDVEFDPVAAAIASRGLRVYRVTGRSVINLGIKPGELITVDHSRSALDRLKGLEAVLVEIGPARTRVLRQFIPPTMLVTNRGGANLAISFDDPTVKPEVIGVVLPAGAAEGSEIPAPAPAQTPPRRQ